MVLNKDVLINNLSKFRNNVIICRNSDPVDSMIEIVKVVSKKYKKICFVSVDKPFPILTAKFKKEGVDYSNISFVDCISSLSLQQVPSRQCKYLDSPRALQSLAIILGEELHEADCLILDNVSSLLVYNDDVSALHFLNNLMHQMNFFNTKAVYLFTHDTRPEVMEDISLFADKVEII